jgi:16S rRNA (guanine966-N2)-methyltransferase
MRVIGGNYGGRILKAPKGHKTHPMSEKMRGAIANSLGDITGARVLDAFAGSGAVGIELLSRGARFVQFIDNDKHASMAISDNLSQLALMPSIAKNTKAPLHSWIEGQRENKFTLIVADPPYDRLQTATVVSLEKLLAPKGVLVLSWPPRQDKPVFVTLKLLHEKSYGDSTLSFYTHIAH